ncbi:hypothetical protein SAMD00019534_107330 [Acytostelium subglobosum LB1]|uniref:hypothetical protein n=1 Tax=Acytostelium subglobosum LB1 TaxID=1410327 RepID=UPI0006449BBF|nr:hypothetical protein SAMD00019534_107330 [Acytostelium subglobosum LB1]GAM27557.1 hypothetical protein SAMD00019534_107330 [Acytostelium subglobosum LB1]|eukprot:XP_012749622.1 hypothetical protein SAMD00019534_107330 [Acytostelium subglobosum LB1]
MNPMLKAYTPSQQEMVYHEMAASTPPSSYSPLFRAYGNYHYASGGSGGSSRYCIDPMEDDQMDVKLYEQTQRFIGRIQFLEEEINRKKETIDGLQHQLTKYEQERQAEKKKQSRYWTPEEHHRFLEALSKFGHRDVKSIANFVGTRNATQVRTHAQKYFLRIDRERQRKLENRESFDKDDRNNDEWLREDYGDDIDSPSLLSSNNSFHTNSPGSIIPINPFTSSSSMNSSGQNSPNFKRKRETVSITAAQAKNAQLYKESVLSAMPSNWTAVDYEYFSRGLISFIDQDDTHTLFKMIKDQFLNHHSIETIEMAYRAFLKAVNHKSKETSPLNSPGGSAMHSGSSAINNPNISLNNNNNNNNNNMTPSNGSPNIVPHLALPSNLNNSTNNSPEPTSPHMSRNSPRLFKKRIPPVNINRPEYTSQVVPPGPVPSPGSLYGGGMPPYMTGSTMMVPPGLPLMHPSSPNTAMWTPRSHPSYDIRRLEPPPYPSLMSTYMPQMPLSMMGDGGGGGGGLGQPMGGNDSPNNGHHWQGYGSVDGPGASWSMNQTISAFSHANINSNNNNGGGGGGNTSSSSSNERHEG